MTPHSPTTDGRGLSAAELTVAEVLNRAADLIEPEGAWTQYEGARDASGKGLPDVARHPDAVCWCIGGALLYVTGRPVPGTEVARLLHNRLGGNFVNWNDASERTQAEVVAALRAAAARVQS